jgi:hypothetical protein
MAKIVQCFTILARGRHESAFLRMTLPHFENVLRRENKENAE